MSYTKWLIITAMMTALFAAAIVALNLCVDHHAVRLSLFSGKAPMPTGVLPDGINQHIFNPEYVLRQPNRFDAFVFGSSRTSVINTARIPGGRYFNMSYTQGRPAQHLAILKALIDRGVHIQSVIIGLDEFSFFLPPFEEKRHLLRIMHPDIGGPSRAELFALYFFRNPEISEIERWRDRVIDGKVEGHFRLDNHGLNLGWQQRENLITLLKQPIFEYRVKRYEPAIYGKAQVDAAFDAISKIIDLGRNQGFTVHFFISPLYDQFYLNHALPLFEIKQRLASLTDFHDFSGFNSVTGNPMNYYDESHYRYHIADRIIRHIVDADEDTDPTDFGVRVTAGTVATHLDHQRLELDRYLQEVLQTPSD